MSNLIKLLFALFLGVIAAGSNWLWLSAKAKPAEFVAAKSTLKVGRKISEEDLVAVPVPGELEQLKKSLIPYRNRALLFGASASRTYEPGDVFFQRDIQPPEQDSEWTAIGPFRLVSVGARFKEPNAATEDYVGDSSRNNVTIEVSADFDQKTRRLLDLISPTFDGKKRESSNHIVAVQVIPSAGHAPARQSQPSPNTVYQTVSLEGITHVPRVLLAGDRILFVTPGRKKY